MLPFLKPKKQTGLIIETRKPDGSHETKHEEDEADHGVEACAEDIIRAIHAKDAQQLAKALHAIFEIMEEQPHEEGPHINEEEQE